jgi:hypothetical protein
MMRTMKGWTCLLVLALAACTGGDDTADGTRGPCAEGGELNNQDCHANPQTPWDACWRMVDCGAIPVHQEDPNRDDFDNCLERIEGRLDAAQLLVIQCIGASTCDQLRLDNDRCFLFGREP